MCNADVSLTQAEGIHPTLNNHVNYTKIIEGVHEIII